MTDLTKPLLYNTKWREIWQLICRHRLRFHFQYVREPSWNRDNQDRLFGPFTEEDVLQAGIGGPYHFKDIGCIRFPRDATPTLDEFLENMARLGNTALMESEASVAVYGYEEQKT